MPDLLHYLGNCPVCNRRLRSDKAAVVEKTPRLLLVGVDCEACWVSLVLTIFFNTSSDERGNLRLYRQRDDAGREHEVTLVGMVTDLTAEDTKRSLTEPPVTLDDVLTLHQYFKKRKS